MKTNVKQIKDGGVTSAKGFVASGIAAGIKASGNKDMALVVSTQSAEVAAALEEEIFPGPAGGQAEQVSISAASRPLLETSPRVLHRMRS